MAQLDPLQRGAREGSPRTGKSPLDWDEVAREIAGWRESAGEELVTHAGQKPTAPMEEEFQPRTPLGRRLWELRKEIVASGEPLLDWDGIEREVTERRGGISERDL